MPSSTTTQIRTHWLRYVVGTIVVLVIWIGIGLLPWMFLDDHEDAALLGDSFGFVAALFSALALGGVVASLLLQREELGLQRQELAETRSELRRSADAQESQRRALVDQVTIMHSAALIGVVSSQIGARAQELIATETACATAESRLRVIEEVLAEELSPNAPISGQVRAMQKEHPAAKERVRDLRRSQSTLRQRIREMESQLSHIAGTMPRPVPEGVSTPANP